MESISRKFCSSTVSRYNHDISHVTAVAHEQLHRMGPEEAEDDLAMNNFSPNLQFEIEDTGLCLCLTVSVS